MKSELCLGRPIQSTSYEEEEEKSGNLPKVDSVQAIEKCSIVGTQRKFLKWHFLNKVLLMPPIEI